MAYDDRGNWTSGHVGVGILKGTKYGISAMEFPSIDVANISMDYAETIYFSKYWPAFMEELPDPIAFLTFDAEVNSGLTVGSVLLQETVGAYVDGDVGDLTIKAMNLYLKSHIMLEACVRYQALHLQKLATFNVWADDRDGFINRNMNNILVCSKLIKASETA